MHLGRPFLPRLPPCQRTADISAARNLNNPGYIVTCTYIIVIKVFLQEHFFEIADMFLQEHSPGPAPTSRGPIPLGRMDGSKTRPHTNPCQSEPRI